MDEWQLRILTGDPHAGTTPHQRQPALTEHAPGRSVRVPQPLTPFRRYRWCVTGDAGEVAQEFETGPLAEADWSADWVEAPTGSAIVVRFSVSSSHQFIRLHFAAQGLLFFELNGSPVNPGRSEPVRSAPSVARYRTYDLDGHCAKGTNTLVAHLGRGDWSHSGYPPRARFEVTALTAHSVHSVLARSSEEAQVVASHVVTDEPFYLERIDHRDRGSQRDWAIAAVPVNAPLLPLTIEPDVSPSVRTTRRVAGTEVTRRGGVRVFDIGENVAGRSRIELWRHSPESGTMLRVIHAEHLDASGRADTTNLSLPGDVGRPRQVVEHVLDSDRVTALEGVFALHGFRFIEVIGADERDEMKVSALVIHSDLDLLGEMQLTHQPLARLLDIAHRTALNTMHGIPEDCPTREQAGWTGDAAAVAGYTFAAFDLESFAAKWIDDLLRSQRSDGSIPAVAPDVRSVGFDTDPVWGSALPRMVEAHWLTTGDADVARRSLSALRRWADYLLGLRDTHGIVSGAPVSYGHDWLALEQTPPELLHTAAAIEQLGILARLERDVGATEEAANRSSERAELICAFRAAFVHTRAGSLQVANNSQGALATAVVSDALTSEEYNVAIALIEADIASRGYRVSTGYAATRALIDALGGAGLTALMLRVLDTPDEPGIGAMLRHGHGTFWECWWIDPANTGTGSLDHIGLGGVFAGWVWRWLLGLQPLEAGFRRFRVGPQPTRTVGTMSAQRKTPFGEIAITVESSQDVMTTTVEVPAGTVCEFHSPEGGVDLLASGVHIRTSTVGDRLGRLPLEEDWRWGGYPMARPTPDEDGSRLAAVSRAQSLQGRAIIADVEPLRCMPVPHAQLEGPIFALPPAAAGTTRGLTIDFESPTVAAGFAFAWLDLCSAPYQPGLTATLTVIGSHGQRRSNSTKLWPAGWNRLYCDLTTWPIDELITQIHIMVPTEAEARGWATAPVDVARVGLSEWRRTW